MTDSADSSCRIGAVCQIREGDVKRDANEIFIRRAKGGKSKTVAVRPETMAIIPERAHGQFVFHAIKDDSKPMNRGVVGHVLRRAIKAIGIPDGHTLDIHSFRRAWVSHATRTSPAGPAGAQSSPARTTLRCSCSGS
jgi:integrase